MSTSSRVTFFLLWVASLLIVGGLVSAQSLRKTPDPGQVISGDDLGFKPDGWDGKARTGTFVVRINGEWVEAKDSMKMVHATR